MSAEMRAAAVDLAKREIIEDRDAGRFDDEVTSFSDLHDHVDANEYGGLTVPPVTDLPAEQWHGLCEAVQCEVDAWIKDGGLIDNPRALALAEGTALGTFEDHADGCDFYEGRSGTCTCPPDGGP